MAVLDILNFLRTEYKPAPGEFLPIDMPGLVKKLQLRERGAERGKQGIPTTQSASFDEIENEIVEAIRTLALTEEKRTNDQLTLYQTRMQAADPGGAAAEMRATAMQSVAQFEAEATAAKSELQTARLNVVERKQALMAFRDRNQLVRPADLPKNHFLLFGLLAILFLVETGPNAVLFGTGDELGILGGYAIAVVFSFLNLAFGFLAGIYGWTNAGHRQYWRKAVGIALALVLIALIIALNLLVAHFREETSAGMTTALAGRESITALRYHPFDIHDALSIGLAIMGSIFAIVAMLEGYAWSDSYPGYAAVTRNFALAEVRWSQLIEERLTMLDSVQKRHAEELRASRASLRDRHAAIPEILAASARLARNFGLHVQHLEGVGRYALSAYRDANRAARAADKPAPARFDEPWSLKGVTVPDIQPIVSGASEAEWQAANQALEGSMEKLQHAFQGAIDGIKLLAQEHADAAVRRDMPVESMLADGRAA